MVYAEAHRVQGPDVRETAAMLEGEGMLILFITYVH